MVRDRFEQELHPGALVVTACSGYSGTGRLEVGVITKVNMTVIPNYYEGGVDRVTGTISLIKLTYSREYTNLHGSVRPASFHEKKSNMSNTDGMIVIQGPDCFTAQFPDMVRERILLLMAEYTR